MRKLYAAGNGSVLFVSGNCVVDHIGTYSINFFTADLDMDGVLCKKEYIPGAVVIRFIGRSPLEKSDDLHAEVKLTVYADPFSQIIFISIAAMFDVHIKIQPCEKVRFEFFESYSSDLEKRSCLKLLREETAMYLMANVNSEFDRENMLFHIKPGYSRLFVTVPSDEENFLKFKALLKKMPPVLIFDSSPSDLLYKSVCRRKNLFFKCRTNLNGLSVKWQDMISYCRETVYNFQSKNGGFFSLENSFNMIDMCRIFRFLIADGDQLQAKAFAEFIYSVFEKYRSIPFVCNPDKNRAIFLENTYNPAGDAVLISLYEYEKQFGSSHDSRISVIADTVMKNDYRLVKGGMMPFSGMEGYFYNALMKPWQRFQGSAESTMCFLGAARRYLDIMADKRDTPQYKRIAMLVKYTVDVFPENFLSGEKVYLNAPKRAERTYHPHTLSGLCDNCFRFGRLVYRSHRYLCGKCEDIADKLTHSCCGRAFFNGAVFLDRYVGAGLFPDNTVFEDISPEKMNTDGLIMSIKYYCQRRDIQALFLSELISRYENYPKRFSFAQLCHAAAETVRMQANVRKTNN